MQLKMMGNLCLCRTVDRSTDDIPIFCAEPKACTDPDDPDIEVLTPFLPLPRLFEEQLEMTAVCHPERTMMHNMRALACSRESPDVVKRYEEMLMRLRRAAEYMMSARVNAVPLEVLQLVRVWREYCCHRFAWALISISDIQWLQTQLMERSNKTYHPLTILDPLAGTGWHCYLMRGLGWTSSFEVSDSHPASPSMLWVTPVCARDALESVRAMPRADVLWLSWPPHEPQPIAFSLLNAFCGCTVIYIGEWPAASTTSVSQGARMFFEALRSDWIEKARRKAEVNWPGFVVGTCGDIICIPHFRAWQRKQLQRCRQTEHHHGASSVENGSSSRNRLQTRQADESTKLLDTLRVIEQKKTDLACKIEESRKQTAKLNARIEVLERAEEKQRRRAARELHQRQQDLGSHGFNRNQLGRRQGDALEALSAESMRGTWRQHQPNTSSNAIMGPTHGARSSVSHCSGTLDEDILRKLGTGERGDLSSLMGKMTNLPQLPRVNRPAGRQVRLHALYYKALIHQQQGHIQSSLQLFQAAASLDPLNVDYLKHVAKNLSFLGQHQPALEIYSEAIKRDPDDWELHYNIGVCQKYLGNYSLAISSFRAANDIQRHDTTYIELAEMQARRGDSHAAIDTYTEALEFSPENAKILTRLGVLLLKADDSYKAFECLGNSLVYDPKDPPTILAAGSVIQDHGDVDVALVKYRVAAVEIPSSAELWNNVGMCFFGTFEEKQKLVAAIACLKRAITLEPQRWRTQFNLGLLHSCTGQYASAFTFFSAALNLDPKHPLIYM
ncbi:bardet-biedl syndrome 4, bbs4, putative [Perkinsus marinus ATCC 50983]|uniref:Bardet-biedl syndrome 4, bbs4, putative n=1 Tax=Perkinsus marinus (strain ATCC 50983 / TXsc) TaxID=423536 RepID=C5K856_PERM5|nr:bardet-biedl syndrome 4, bbs4, putative [Perkinsus marinus ATCC 50983]EER19326.1 bardet-biedl syndrome 4, bbs4, putative [Perkinsus marinus ATCC 50983]|eukprot:XP_002787530.1 bardet-biedl syndrome 4, bbs4, putative [Perkinsus marinus ATCC 50983]